MARSSYNYTLAEQHAQKIYIPYLNLEFKGWLPLITAGVGVFTITFVLGTMLSFLLGGSGYLYAFGSAMICVLVTISYSNENNKETGRNRLWNFYYMTIKNYCTVYDSNGCKHYIEPKRNGVIYYARR